MCWHPRKGTLQGFKNHVESSYDYIELLLIQNEARKQSSTKGVHLQLFSHSRETKGASKVKKRKTAFILPLEKKTENIPFHNIEEQ